MAQRGNRRGLTRRRGSDHYIWYESQLGQAQHVVMRAAAGRFGRIGVLPNYVKTRKEPLKTIGKN